MAQHSSLLGVRDVQDWQLPVNWGVNCALLAWFFPGHQLLWWFTFTPCLPAFVGVIILAVVVTTSLFASGTACTTCTGAAALACTAPTAASTSTAAGCWLLSWFAPAGASCTTRGLLGCFGPVCQLNTIAVRGIFVPVDFGHGDLLSMLPLEVGDELPHLVSTPTSFCESLLQSSRQTVVDKEGGKGLGSSDVGWACRQSKMYLLLHPFWCFSSLRRSWGTLIWSLVHEYSSTTFLSALSPGVGFFFGAFFPLPIASGFPPVSFRAVCFVRAIQQGDLHLTFVR